MLALLELIFNLGKRETKEQRLKGTAQYKYRVDMRQECGGPVLFIYSTFYF